MTLETGLVLSILYLLTNNPQTANVLTWFMLPMIFYFEKQKKCRRVIGPACMLTF